MAERKFTIFGKPIFSIITPDKSVPLIDSIQLQDQQILQGKHPNQQKPKNNLPSWANNGSHVVEPDKKI